MEALTYPPLEIDGIPPELTWRLYSAGNYPYYCKIYREIQTGTCPFCQIDTNLNKEIEGINNPSWRVWDNPISKLGGNGQKQPPTQFFQFVIPLRRHITSYHGLTRAEENDLFDMFRALDAHFGITGGAQLGRWGNPLQCARSQPHYHWNYHVPIGSGEVRPWLAKDTAGLEKKRSILLVFERMRTLQEKLACSPEGAFAFMELHEVELVRDLLSDKASC